MRQWLIEMLKRLEFLAPPPPNCHHAITYAEYGEPGDWHERLALQVNYGGEFLCFFLQDEDFAQEPVSIANEVAEQIRKGTAGMQRGVAMGQYLEP
jgi:hypothetical protein